ncbi:sulfite exporter TauE/SafE family protein [Arvimicrobium flavum]|uniref:sulfite exporter TauE/SafE family protein n=1 Tax=Arvimicrobium flavum TaxID=3393320 RepID=UPI00237B4AE9|nr:sulfite exporter TauE/SafE family protein [Mesorhizobium shangrilense]
MPTLLFDPLFYAAAIPAVVLVGLSKGGLGGAMGFAGVPLMALVVSPVQAAAILLPILLLMDLVSLWTWRGVYDRSLLRSMMPGSIVGIGIGWITAAMVTAPMIRFIVGAVAIVFVGRWVFMKIRDRLPQPKKPNLVAASIWGTVTGFTSFVAHVGGPPFQFYALPLRLDPKVLTGTSVIFFAITNAVKLVPYSMLGQFDATNLLAAAVLMPLAPVATLAGAWVVRRLRPETFYNLSYATVGLIAIKLVYDGVIDWLAL